MQDSGSRCDGDGVFGHGDVGALRHEQAGPFVFIDTGLGGHVWGDGRETSGEADSLTYRDGRRRFGPAGEDDQDSVGWRGADPEGFVADDFFDGDGFGDDRFSD